MSIRISLVLLFLVTAAMARAEEAATPAVLNPNLATEEQLGSIELLNDAAVEALTKAKPILSAIALYAVLVEHLGAEAATEALKQLFVPINLNTATREEILLVPGVGKRMAHEFEEYRPYSKLAQFRREIGKYVDDDEVARLEQYVFVPVSLNAGTDEEILAIPGVGKRMLHEFKEYRPYKSIEQFRREIGKYVDAAELARLERYIVVD